MNNEIRNQVEQKAEEVASKVKVEVLDVWLEPNKQLPFEDDGMLHITQEGFRIVFDVSKNQTLSAKKQNKNTANVLAEYGLEMTERVLA